MEQDRHISVATTLLRNWMLQFLLQSFTKVWVQEKTWVPHDLTEKNLMQRVSTCNSLLKRNNSEPFLKQLITGDEKWVTYDKNVRKRL